MPQITLLDAARLPEDHPARVPDFWTRAMLAHPEVTEAARDAALTAAGLPLVLDLSQPLAVTQRHEAVIVDTLAASLADPSFPARAGMSLHAKAGSVLTYILFSAARLGEMLALLTRYLPITRTKSKVTLTPDGNGAALRMWQTDPQLIDHGTYHEFAMGAVLHMIRSVVGQPVLGERVRFAHDSRLTATDLASIYECPVEMGAEAAAVHLPGAALDLPLLNADGQLLSHLQAYGDILLKRRRQDDPTTADRIEAAVVDRLPHGAPTLAQIARDLGLSTRTLSRRLTSEGKTYRDLLEHLRFDLAKRYLDDPQLPLAEIAFLLGFSDQSSFGTAFRRWSQVTPGQYRQAL